MASLPQGVYNRHHRPASAQLLSRQYHRSRQTVIMQANTEPVPPNPNAHQDYRRRTDLLYQIIIRQECQTHRLEQQLAQSEARVQQLSHEILSLQHMLYSGASQSAHAKLPPIRTPRSNSTWTQEKVHEGAFRGRQEDTQFSHKQEEDGWHQGNLSSAEGEQDERGS